MKLFTLEEANELLPTIKQLFDRIAKARAKLKRLAPEAKRASEFAGGGGTSHGLEYVEALTTLMVAAQEIANLGVEIKDFERGLCDFPHLRDGEVVYLCWQRGEEQIEWWHEVDAGFAGRQPL